MNEREIIIKVDGACSGNPGLIGIGGVLLKSPMEEVLHMFSLSKGIGTNNEAQYLAIIEGLKSVIKLDLDPASVVVQTDSHLIINQLLGDCVVEDERLICLRKSVYELIKNFECLVEFSWISESCNVIAETLAYKGANMPLAFLEESKIVLWKEDLDHCLKPEDMSYLPKVNPETRKQIDFLNESSLIIPSKLISLMSFGMDRYSRAKIEDLLGFIEIRFGYSAKDYLTRTLENLNSSYSKAALRWVARGLKPNLALRKAAIELEIKEN